MKTLAAEKPQFKACSTQFFRAEFGVCRGEAISDFGDLNLGDIYLVKRGAVWTDVDPLDGTSLEFSMDVAANVAPAKLITLARLIFMTTTGRRADVFATLSHGQMYLVSEAPLAVGNEYVLVQVEPHHTDIDMQAVQAPVEQLALAVNDHSNIVRLGQIG